jgi:hypothetical protein
MATVTEPRQRKADSGTAPARWAAPLAGRTRFWAIAVGLALVTWPVSDGASRTVELGLKPGFDASGAAALHLAHSLGLEFGSELIFHYGPLGFLNDPVLVYGPTSALAFVYAAAVQLALTASVLLFALRKYGLLAAVAITWVVAAIAPEAVAPAELVPFIVFLLCMAAIQGFVRPRFQRRLVVLGGLVAGAHLLVKLDTGVAMLAVLAVCSWALPPGRWRSELLLAGSFLLGAAAGWLAAGGGADAIGDFLRASRELVSGYADATAIEKSHKWDYPAAVVLAALVTVVVVRSVKPPQRAVFGLAIGVFAFLQFKHAFVHHDPFHAHAFFLAAVVVPLALWWPERRWSRLGLATSGVALVVLLASIVGLGPLLKSTDGVRAFRDPVSAVSDGARQALTLASGKRRREEMDEARRRIRREYPLSPAVRGMLAGHSVHVEPWEVTVAWAYGLDWRPVPVFQPYNAWSDYVDDLSADHLRARRAPERILRLEPPVDLDDRNPDFESPAYVAAMLCHYRPLHTAARTQVLERVGSRCGAPRRIGSATARAARPVRVPGAGPRDLVYATIDIPKRLVDRVRDLAFKPLPVPRILIDGRERYRLVAGTAVNPLVMRVPSVAGFAPDFESRPHTRKFTLENVPGTPRVEFYAVRMRR